MSAGLLREIMVQVIIVVAVVLGGWHMLIAPRAEALQALEAVINDGESAVASLDEEIMHELSNRVSEVRERIGKIARANELAGDTSQIYGRLTELARRHGVRPVSLTSDISQASIPGIGVEGLMAVPIHMTLEGPYESVARFLEDAASIGGFIRPESMHITPLQRGEKMLVTARVTCEVLQFPMSQVFDTMGEADDDDS